MYIFVIPLEKSQSKHPSIYEVSEPWKSDIHIGYLVEIPIGQHIARGIVYAIDISLQDGFDAGLIRPIISVIATVEILSLSILSIIVDIADRYFLLIHKVASLFLPAPLLSRLDKKNYLITQDLTPLLSTPKKEIHHFIQEIFSLENIKSYLEPKTLFLFPDDSFLSFFTKNRELFPDKDIHIYKADMTPTRRAASWIDIYGGKHDIIFGTRRILYYNLSAYTHIVYVEDAFANEYYSYPTRIQHLHVLASLARRGTNHITIITSSPTLFTLSLFSDFSLLSKR